MMSNIRQTMRLSSYQLLIVIVGCALLSFRTGLIISLRNRQNREVQPQDDQCVDENWTTPIAAVVDAETEKKILLGIGSDFPKSNIPLCAKISRGIIDKYTYNTINITSVEKLHEIHHHLYPRKANLSWSRNGAVLQRDKNDSASLEFWEAMVHPSLLIHPNPYRIVILNDIGCQILRQVLKHKIVQEVIYVLPESFSKKLSLTNLTDSRVIVVYTDDLVTYFHHSTPIDALFVDAATYVKTQSIRYQYSFGLLLLSFSHS